MKRTILVFPILVLALATLACQVAIPRSVQGSGNASSEVRQVSDFNTIALEGMGDVFITVGETESLTIQADDNLLPLLTSKVQNGTLKLGIVSGANIHPVGPITFNVTVKELNSITLAGSGNFYVDPFETDRMTVTIAGSGDINLKGLALNDFKATIAGSGNVYVDEITAENVDSTISGSGDIRLVGEAPTQKLGIYGSGDYLAGDLQTKVSDITIAGSGNVTVWSTDQLTIVINGSGDINYYGKPSVDKSGAGSGDLKSLGEK